MVTLFLGWLNADNVWIPIVLGDRRAEPLDDLKYSSCMACFRSEVSNLGYVVDGIH